MQHADETASHRGQCHVVMYPVSVWQASGHQPSEAGAAAAAYADTGYHRHQDLSSGKIGEYCVLFWEKDQ